MKKFLSLALLFTQPLHGGTLFLNSTPPGADVFVSEGKKKPRHLGRTPIRIPDATNTVLILSKSGYAPQTNTYRTANVYQGEEVILAPLSFTVNFPVDSGAVRVNGKNYSSLDGNLVLPYGNYDARYDKKKALFVMEAKSPYTPYVAVFATTLIVSLGMAIGGAVAEPKFRDQFNTATDFGTASDGLFKASTMNNLKWTGVGIGTGSLLGLAVFSYYEAREQKRIRRFQSRNEDYSVVSDLTEFNEILTTELSEQPLTAFIRKYRTEGSRYLPKVYLRRAQFYADAQKYTEALRDLNVLVNDLPDLEVYGSANMLLGDIQMARQQFREAYGAYKEGALLNYPNAAKKSLEALSRAVQKDKTLAPLLAQEIEAARKDRRFTDKAFLDTLNRE